MADERQGRTLADRLFHWGRRDTEDAAGEVPAGPEKPFPTKVLPKFLAALAHRDAPALLDLGPVVGPQRVVLRRAAGLQDPDRGPLRGRGPFCARGPLCRPGAALRGPAAAGGCERGRHPLLGPLRLSRQALVAGARKAVVPHPEAGRRPHRRVRHDRGHRARLHTSSSSPTIGPSSSGRIAPRVRGASSSTTATSACCSPACASPSRSCC